LRRESAAKNLLAWAPIASTSPASTVSVCEDPTRNRPNLSDEEPLFNASTFKFCPFGTLNCGRSAALPRCRAAALPRCRYWSPATEVT
jgi:hypothetical protein